MKHNAAEGHSTDSKAFLRRKILPIIEVLNYLMHSLAHAATNGVLCGCTSSVQTS
jgi:hypothetical protein